MWMEIPKGVPEFVGATHAVGIGLWLSWIATPSSRAVAADESGADEVQLTPEQPKNATP